MQQSSEVDGLPFLSGSRFFTFHFYLFTYFDELRVSDNLLQALYTDFSKIFAHLLSQEGKVVHHVFCATFEVLAQLRVLGCHTHRTGVRIAFAHHHTSQDDERQCTKRELVSTEHSHDHHILGSLQLSVGLQAHLVAQTVHHQCLLRLSKAYLGRDTRKAHT